MKTFKAYKTGRIYDVEQVLYCSIEKTGHCDIMQEDEFRIVLIDPSRGISYVYERQYFIKGADGMCSTYDHSRGSFLSESSEDFSDLEKYFGIKEIREAIIEIKNARYEMSCTHDLDRKHELSVEIGQVEVFIGNQFEGRSAFGDAPEGRCEPQTLF